MSVCRIHWWSWCTKVPAFNVLFVLFQASSVTIPILGVLFVDAILWTAQDSYENTTYEP